MYDLSLFFWDCFDNCLIGKHTTPPFIHICILYLTLSLLLQWNSGQIVKMGWTVTEDLLCVQDDGVVLVYDFFLNFKRTFGLGQVVN